MAEILLYTAQQPVVLEALERDGVSRVRREYIDKKYGDTAWSFQEAYAFFRREMAQRIPPSRGGRIPPSGSSADTAGPSHPPVP